MTIWKNLINKPFEERIDKWFNLSTNRFIKKLPADESLSWTPKGIRVVGSIDKVKEFLQINNIKREIFNPTNDIGYLCEEAVKMSQLCCSKKEALMCQTTDIEKIPDDILAKIGNFSLGGLFLKCKVLNIIDGDTLTVSLFVPLMSLSMPRDFKEIKSPIGLVNINGEDQGFFTTITIRTYGYDAIEKNHPLHQEAKSLLTHKMNSLNNIVWAYFIEPSIGKDKWGRHLAVLWEDQKRRKMLNTFLRDQNNKLVNPYRGGTKKVFD